MTLNDYSLIVSLVILIVAIWIFATKKIKSYKLNVKQDDYIFLFCGKSGAEKKLIVKNYDEIRAFCNKYHKVRCHVIRNTPPHLCFDGSLIEFFIEHINAGNQAATFDVEAAKKLQASNRKFDY